MTFRTPSDRHTGGAWVTGAVVFRGDLAAVDAAIRAIEGRADVKLVYATTAPGRLRIQAEGGP